MKNVLLRLCHSVFRCICRRSEVQSEVNSLASRYIIFGNFREEICFRWGIIAFFIHCIRFFNYRAACFYCHSLANRATYFTFKISCAIGFHCLMREIYYRRGTSIRNTIRDIYHCLQETAISMNATADRIML